MHAVIMLVVAAAATTVTMSRFCFDLPTFLTPVLSGPQSRTFRRYQS